MNRHTSNLSHNTPSLVVRLTIPQRDALTGAKHAVEIAPAKPCLAVESTALPASSSDEASDARHARPVDKDDDAAASHNTTKKRKSTYYMRKDEVAVLRDEANELENRLANLHRLHPAHTSTRMKCAPNDPFRQSLQRNDALRRRVAQGDLDMATAESLFASRQNGNRAPLHSFIHLPRCHHERQQTLSNLKQQKLQDATKYMLARCQFLDLTQSQMQSNKFDDPTTGGRITTHWEVTPLPEASSVQRVFEELVYFVETQEMSLTEKLGVTTTRETCSDEGTDDATQMRMLTTHDDGQQVETNAAVFQEYFDKTELLDRPHALLVAESVDDDELFPYQPQTRFRKHLSSIVMITECPGPAPLVVMVRWVFLCCHCIESPERGRVAFVDRGVAGHWGDVMIKCIRERLRSTAAAAVAAPAEVEVDVDKN